MITEKRFFAWWALLLVGVWFMVIVVMLIPISILHWSAAWLLLSLLWVPVFISIVLKNKLLVLPEWTLVCEWKGDPMQPLKNGWHYPFPWLDLFVVKAEVPMNKRALNILSGVRDGLPAEIVNKYVYGTASNLEPSSGHSLRLLYSVEFICRNPSSLVYKVNNPFDYVAGVIQKQVDLYVRSHKSEFIIKNFMKEDLDSIIQTTTKDKILSDIGLELLSFIPADVILNPKAESLRITKYEKEVNIKLAKLDTDKEVKIEEGKKKILVAQLKNMKEVEGIADKKNEILKKQISSVKSAAGVDGEKALHFITKENTLSAVAEASKNGSITYIDESNGNGNLSQGAALGFAINSASKK